jgi:hypothetical protein
VPQQNRKALPIIVLAMLLVVGVGAAGASLLSGQGRGTSHNSPSTSPAGTAPVGTAPVGTAPAGTAPVGTAPGAGAVPEVAPPAPAVAPPAPAAPQVTAPGPPLAPAEAAPPRAVQRSPRPYSGKVRDEDPQRLRRAFTRYFCVHGQLPSSYCRSHA